MLKGLAWRLWRFGFEGEPGLGEEAVDEAGPVLDAFEPVLDDRGELVHVSSGEVAQAVLHVRLGAFGRVELGGVGGQLHDGQPVRVRAGELAHGGAAVGVQVVPVTCPAWLCGRRNDPHLVSCLAGLLTAA